MNILNKLTIRNLKLNKVRSLVAIFGIVLATMLITTTIGLGSSLYQTLINHQIEDTGDYHVRYINLTEENRKIVTNNRHIDYYYATNDIGYSKVNITNKAKKYIKIVEYSDKAFEANGIKVIDGRLPKNSNEIVLQKKMFDYGFEKKVGDTITINVGGLVDDEESTQNEATIPSSDNVDEETHEDINVVDDKLINEIENEDVDILEDELINVKEQTYTIVGVIDELGYGIESYGEPYYTAITYNNDILNPSDIYVKYDKPTKTLEYVCPIVTDNDADKNKCLNKLLFKSKIDYQENSDLLYMYGVGVAPKQKIGILAMLVLILMIISVCCIFIIKNSFSISVNERYKQFGMFSSIGATSKQIKQNVLFEGLIEGIISIPLGILFGIGLVYALTYITNMVLDGDVNIYYEQMLCFNIPIIAIVIVTIVSAITIYFSCLIPALKISKISPMEAIRNNNEIKLNKKKLKGSKLIKNIFGIGGSLADKNIKRNRKKNHTIVISLTISLVLFIGISGAIDELKDKMKDMADGINYNANISMYFTDDYNTEVSEEEYLKIQSNKIAIFEKIGNSSLVEKYSYIDIVENVFIAISNEEIEREYKYDPDNGTYEDYKKAIEYFKTHGDRQSIMVVNDDEFKRLSNKLKLDDEDLKNGVLIYNYNHIEDETTGKISEEKYLDSSIDELTLRYFDYQNNSDIPSEILNVKILGEVDLSSALLNGQLDSFTIIVSNKFMEAHPKLKIKFTAMSYAYFYTPSVEELEKYINTLGIGYDYYFYDVNKELQSINNEILIMNIFVYTFIILIMLISITNIFNTISTSMMLRKKEFAILRSMGMTDNEFRRMIILESILYSVKALIYGVAISLILSYFEFNAGINNTFIYKLSNLFKHLSYMSILISIFVVLFVVLVTMFYSLSKINKQNIIETIRNDNS